jgi:hypothetical protein
MGKSPLRHREGTQDVNLLVLTAVEPLFGDDPTRYGPAPRTGTRSAGG